MFFFITVYGLSELPAVICMEFSKEFIIKQVSLPNIKIKVGRTHLYATDR